MTFALLTGLVFFATAVVLVLRAVAMSRLRVSQRLGAIEAYGYADSLGSSDETSETRLQGIAQRLGDAVFARAPRLSEDDLRRELMAAGMYETSPRVFLGYRVLTAGGLTALLLWSAVGGGNPALMLVLLTLSVVVGWMLPITIVRRRAKTRTEEVDRELPELIDLLVVTVEAGIGFSGSLKIAGTRLKGALGDEVRLALQEESMGLTTNEALSNMVARNDTPSLRSFVRSVVQGETLGVSIGSILRSVAVEMRKRRRQAAEERAQKAPVKMLFPLIFLIFPALFIVVFGPAAFDIFENLGGA
jgi:tight adherence protein C